MNVYYEKGATHNDHHKEINIQGNITAEALDEIVAEFMPDDTNNERSNYSHEVAQESHEEPVKGCTEPLKGNAEPAKGRPAEPLFKKSDGTKDEPLTALMAEQFTRYLKEHHLRTKQLDTKQDNPISQSFAAFYAQWCKDSYITIRQVNARAIYHFLREDCHLSIATTQKSYEGFIRNYLNRGDKNYDTECKVEDFYNNYQNDRL